MNRFLLEIGLEEMPSNMILPAVDQLKTLIKNTCEKYHLCFDLIDTYSTPRRLAVIVVGLPNKQKDRIIELKGPPAEFAKDKENKWTKSAFGFAKKNGIKINDLKFKNFDGKEYLFCQKKKLGRPVPELLQLHIQDWIAQINFSKNMRWGSYKMRFIRPIRWVLSLWNKKHIPIKLEMLESGLTTKGHRFLSPGMTLINDAVDYKKKLKKLNVLVDFEERREEIIKQVKKLEREFSFDVELDSELLTEVTNLVEWPTVILGEFEEEFLELPDEVLVTSMAVNQRYFPVFQKINKKSVKKKLLPFFVTVRNGDKKNINIVRKGNRKVLCARLGDARFFYMDDQNKNIEEFCQRAKKVVFFQHRGSQSQRVQRIILLSKFIGEKLNFSREQQINIKRISELCKFDLGTLMVQEFPELQGFMGGNYASLKNEKDIVCRGIKEHYLPRNTNDSFPKDKETVSVSLADKFDLLITAFSINLKPSGATDPYALRRAAQGIILLILGLRLSINIQELISKGLIILGDQLSLDLDILKLNEELLVFLVQRQRWFFQEKGFRYDLIDAVLGRKIEDSLFNEENKKNILPIEQLEFAELLSDHLDTTSFKRSVESIVRAENICKKYPQKIAKKIKEQDLLLVEEKNFYNILEPIINSEQDRPWSPSNFLKQIFLIEPVVTQFFENVLVMDEDPMKCGNRLWLCRELSSWSKRHLDFKAIVFP